MTRSWRNRLSQKLTLWPSPAPWPSPFDLAAAGELERRVERALSTLSPQYREVVLLVGHEGLTPTDAAVVCGISPEALRQRLSRARAALAEKLRADARRCGTQERICNMTVDRDDRPDDDFLASLARLRTCDVSQRRSRQLRRRCHAVLQAEPSRGEIVHGGWMGAFRRDIVPALGGAWCLAYLVEIVRCTAAIYGYFGTQ